MKVFHRRAALDVVPVQVCVGVRPFGPDFIEVGMGGLGQQSGGFGRPK